MKAIGDSNIMPDVSLPTGAVRAPKGPGSRDGRGFTSRGRGRGGYRGRGRGRGGHGHYFNKYDKYEGQQEEPTSTTD